ncbi:hypothetical protein C5167_018606 [Papaver somniferum]|uniref:3-hydroxyacyl-CoA dehydrogenase C-terminal domain-containing protein n=1 Tax=Papaver somniferum TaxID=3469 RepID=A0A4Y7IQV8_PAPSO|nr:hypothetical protein C5167_018606 [Papaver somniferum]
MSGGQDLGLSPITTFKRILVLEDLLRGFYVYDNKRKARPDPEIAKYIEKARSMSDAKVYPKLSDKDIIEMIFFPVVNDSCRLLYEGIVVKASDLDIAAVSGMGFPSYRGGIVFWADSLGSKYICSRGSVVRALGFMVAASSCTLAVARLACEVAVHASASRGSIVLTWF